MKKSNLLYLQSCRIKYNYRKSMITLELNEYLQNLNYFYMYRNFLLKFMLQKYVLTYYEKQYSCMVNLSYLTSLKLQ